MAGLWTAALVVLAGCVPFACGAAAPRFAVVSVATHDVVERYAAAIQSKRCYCMLRGYDFVLDTNPYHDSEHGRQPHWNRVAAVRRVLPAFDWVVYMDADVMVTNASVALEAIVAATVRRDGGVPHLIVQDGMEVNNGVFFIDSSQWSLAFLHDWWQLGSDMADHYVSTAVQDQAAMQELLLRLANVYRAPNVVPVDSCAKHQPATCYTQFSSCWWIRMAELGFPLGARSTPVVHYWHEANHVASGIRGFNAISPLSVTAVMFFVALALEISLSSHAEMFFNGWWYHPSRLWQEGDFVMHRVNERRGGAAVSGTRAYWTPAIAQLFDPAAGGTVCPTQPWAVSTDLPFNHSVFGRSIWDDYVQPHVRYVPGTPQHAAANVTEVPTAMGVAHTADVSMHLEVPHRNLSLVPSRFVDIMLLSGAKCAGDFIRPWVKAQLDANAQQLVSAVRAVWDEERGS